MNQTVIIFVPTGATQEDFEAALREYFPSLEIHEKPELPVEADPRAQSMPLWTWFLPNPCP